MKTAFLRVIFCAIAMTALASARAESLRVMLIPADGGTVDGTLADYQPIFRAVGKMTGIEFDLKVGQSYGSVVEAMANRLCDIAFFGPVSYLEARKRGAAELLAVAVEGGESVYYSGIFVATDSPVKSLQDLKGKSVAFGDVNSTSSFVYPLAMIIEAGLDPIRDLGPVRLTGSHANALKALAESQVAAACASFDSFEKALRQGAIDPATVKVLAKSEPIPYPPLAMRPDLAPGLKAKLKKAFAEVHHAPGVTPDMIRGYGGKKVDRYSTTVSEEEFAKASAKIAVVTDALKGELLQKAARR